MQHELATTGLLTPSASPVSFDHVKCLPAQPEQQQQQHQFLFQSPTPPPSGGVHRAGQRYVPVAPEDRIGTFLCTSLRLTGIIGTGAYGVVYEAVDVKTSVRYAVKALSKLNADGTPLEARQIDFQTREIRLHYKASAHPNVVSMFRIIDNYPDCLYVVLEYCPEGDLFYNITECGRFVGNDKLARQVFLQILDAVQCLHQSGIYHRDLKPENILVTDRGNTLKLADFGLATASDRSEDYGCGSMFYMSPECLGQTNSKRPFYYCAPNDVWSLGVILVNLTCGRNPWKQASLEDSTYRAYTRNRGFLKTILPLTDELDDILGRIFHPDPDQRIKLPELRQRILACSGFTVPPLPTPSASPEHAGLANAEDHANSNCTIASSSAHAARVAAAAAAGYVTFDDDCCDHYGSGEEAIVEDDEGAEYAPHSSAVSVNSFSVLAASPTSTTSSECSSLDTLVDDDDDIFSVDDVPEATTPPPNGLAAHPPPLQPASTCAAASALQPDVLAVYEPGDTCMDGMEGAAAAYYAQQQQLLMLSAQQTPPAPPPPQQQPQPPQQFLQQHLHQPPHAPAYQHPMIGVQVPEHVMSFVPPAQQPHPAILQQQRQQQHLQQLQHQQQQQQHQQHQQQLQPPTFCTAPQPKFFLPNVWEWVVGKNAQPFQQLLLAHPTTAFHHQVPMILQGYC